MWKKKLTIATKTINRFKCTLGTGSRNCVSLGNHPKVKQNTEKLKMTEEKGYMKCAMAKCCSHCSRKPRTTVRYLYGYFRSRNQRRWTNNGKYVKAATTKVKEAHKSWGGVSA